MAFRTMVDVTRGGKPLVPAMGVMPGGTVVLILVAYLDHADLGVDVHVARRIDLYKEVE